MFDHVRDALLAGKADEGVVVRKAVVPEVEKVAGTERSFRFVISTDGVDRDNDTIDPKGWDLKNYLKNPVVLWAHDYRQLPIGRATSVSVAEGKLVSEMEFADHPFARTVQQLIEGQFLRATSVGFRPRKYTINEERRGLDFTEQELMEYSIVPVPANPEALIDMRAAKAAGIDVEPLLRWAKGLLTDEEPQEAAADPPKKPCGCTGGESDHQEGCSNKPKAPDVDAVETPTKADGKPCDCPGGANEHAPGCQYYEKPKAACRLCQRELPDALPRVKDDLGLVCAPCFLRAAQPAPVAATDVPSVDVTPAKAETPPPDASVLDLDDDPRAEVAVELDDHDDRDVVVDLSPDTLRAALRSAVTSAVSTLVTEETRAALDRARGRVD